MATAGQGDAEARELQVLKVCLAEVKRCRPFLIVLLGDRYGWVPPDERMAAAAAEEGFAADVAGRSVTHLEIRYGLADPKQQPRSFFYFREPLPYRDMPRDVAALYAEAHDTGPGAAERAQRLAALKREIEAALPHRVRRYSVGWDNRRQRVNGLETWGQRVLEDIWSDLDAATRLSETGEQVTWQQAERVALDDYIEDRARDFIGRDVVLARLEGLAASAAHEGGAWGLVLTGAAGTGKSAVFGELHRRLQRSDTFVLGHAAGASARSPSVDDMLRCWIEELAATLGTDPGLAENTDPDDAIEVAFRTLLGRMAAERRVVVLIDALDQFDATTRARFLTWLPRVWPENARLIATAIPGEASKALAERTGVEVLPLPPLDATEARRIAEGICARYHRTLEPEVLDALLAKRGADGPAWGNTLWLVLAVEELNLVDADDFARAKRAYKGRPAEQLRALMLDIVAGLPTDTIGLYEATFDRAEELYGHNLARAFLGLIAVSRGGWRESDFRIMLPRLSRALQEPRSGLLSRLFRRPQPAEEPWDELRFASLRRLFRGQIRQRGALGQWDFNHAQMRLAARRRLAGHGIGEARFHAEVAGHLLALAADDPLRVSETMVHLLGSEDWARGAGFYGDAALTDAEIDGATRVLSETVLAAGQADAADQLGPLLRLLDAVAHPADRDAANLASTVAQRFLFDLDGMLDQRADLAARAALIGRAGEILNRLANADPGNAGWQYDLGISSERIGDVLMTQGNLSQALKAYQAKQTSIERLAKTDPGNAGWQRDLSVSQTKIGDVLRAQGNLTAALASYQVSLTIADSFAAANLANAGWQRDVYSVLYRIADVGIDQGDLVTALTDLMRGHAIIEKLAEAGPANAGWQRDLCLSHTKIGDVLWARGNMSAALASYQASLAIADRLATADPSNARRQRDLGTSNVRIGEVLRAQGNLAGALKSYQARQAISDRLAKADPGNAEWQRDLSVSHIEIGKVLVEQGYLPAALESYEASHDIFDRLAKADSSNAGSQRDLAASQINIGDVLLAQGNLPAALKSYESALAISDRLAKADPGNAVWQGDLSRSHGSIGDVLRAQGNLAAALTSYQATHDILDRLATADPGNAERQFDLGIATGRIGVIFQAQGNQEDALAAFQTFPRDLFRPCKRRSRKCQMAA